MEPQPRPLRGRIAHGALTLALAGSLVLVDGAAEVESAEASTTSGLSGSALESVRRANAALKKKGFGLYGLRGAEPTSADVTSPRPGSFVHEQFVQGESGAPPKSLGSDTTAVGDLSAIGSASKTYVAVPRLAARAAALMNATAWVNDAQRGWTSYETAVFGEAVPLAEQVDLGIAAKQSPDSSDAQKGEYRKRVSSKSGSVFEVVARWTQKKLRSVGIVNGSDERPVPSFVAPDDVKGFWYGKTGPIRNKSDLRARSGPTNSAAALLGTGDMIIGKPGQRHARDAIFVAPGIEASDADTYYGTEKPRKGQAKNKKYAVVLQHELPGGIRVVDVYRSTGSAWEPTMAQNYQLPPLGWARKHAIPAQKRLMTFGHPVDYDMPSGYEVVRGDYAGLELELLVWTAGDRSRYPLSMWVSTLAGPLGSESI
jgi:hypothetical protein